MPPSSTSPDSGVDSSSTLPGRWLRSAAATSCTPPLPLRSTTAAAPSLGEHSIHNRRGSHTIRDANTSSAVTSARNMASGLWAPQRRFFTTNAARSSTASPCSRNNR